MSDDEAIAIRTAVEADSATISNLIDRLAVATDAADKCRSKPDNFLRYGFGETSLFDALLAEKGGKAVGLCLYFYSFSTLLGEPGVYVQDLYVGEDVRGSGLGRELLAETVRRSAKQGATHLRLCVDLDNTAAQEFYRTIGMRLRDDELIFQADGRAFLDLGGL